MMLNFSIASATLARRRTRRIDQRVVSTVTFERHPNAVAGCARQIEHHHPILAEQAIDQGRLAHIRAADDGDLNAGIGQLPALRLLRRERVHNPTDQGFDAATVSRGNGYGFAQTECEKICYRAVAIQTFALVHHHGDRLSRAPQFRCDLLVFARQSLASVEHKHHMTGFANRVFGLLQHQCGHTQRTTADAASVHNDVWTTAEAADAVLAVPSQTGLIGDQGITRTGQSIEQRGLAHIGPTDQRNHG